MSIAAQCLHGVRVCVVPYEGNNHRPFALRHGPLAFVSALLLITKFAALGVAALMPQPAELATITTARVVQLANIERKQAGLNELTINSLLTQAALQKAQHMLEEDYFAHISPTGVTPWFWMNKIGYRYQVAGENLAIDFVIVEDVVQAWMASPTHKENILHSVYTETGVAVLTGEFQGGTSTVVVQMFGLPVREQALAASPATAGEHTGGTLTPSPSLPPEPTQSAPLDTIPPPVPRIAVQQEVSTIRETVTLLLSGEPNTSVYVLANRQPKGGVTLGQNGEAEYVVSVADLSDGTLSFQAYSRDNARNQSALTEKLTVMKDTEGPLFTGEHVSFIVSPATDRPSALLYLTSDHYETVVITNNGQSLEAAVHPSSWHLPALDMRYNLVLSDEAGNVTELSDVTLNPTFLTERITDYLASPVLLGRFARYAAAIVFMIAFVLLLLTILIRIRIQHFDLITHTSLVLLVAGVLFFL